MYEVTAYVELEEPTDAHSGRDRACMKAIAYLTEAYEFFNAKTELVDVTARKGRPKTNPNQFGYFKIEVTYLAPTPPKETEHITYPESH